MSGLDVAKASIDRPEFSGAPASMFGAIDARGVRVADDLLAGFVRRQTFGMTGPDLPSRRPG